LRKRNSCISSKPTRRQSKNTFLTVAATSDPISSVTDRMEHLWGKELVKIMRDPRDAQADRIKDFESYGFDEIWIADYTGLEAYGDIELFCLYPSEWWGFYERPNPYAKPYG